jgi:hypothetical protein
MVSEPDGVGAGAEPADGPGVRCTCGGCSNRDRKRYDQQDALALAIENALTQHDINAEGAAQYGINAVGWGKAALTWAVIALAEELRAYNAPPF